MSEGNEPSRFDPSCLRVSQDFAANIGVKKELITVPVRKPDRQWFIRVHDDPEYHLDTAVIESHEDREAFLVSPLIRAEIPHEIIPVHLATAINRQGTVFFWQLRLPGVDGRQLEWHRSAFACMDLAKSKWTRVQANMSLAAYEPLTATGDLSDPVWPELRMEGLLEIAFRDRFIDTLDHPLLQQLRGAI